jgi:hypothetical protein
MINKGQTRGLQLKPNVGDVFSVDAIVLDKSIFSQVFEKDIRRVYLFKKSERIAKALSVISPAFKDTPALRDRVSDITVCLIDASMQTPSVAKDVLSRELLSLSGLLAVARSARLLSPMNVEIITREVQMLLQELSSIDESRVLFEEAPSLSTLAKATQTKPTPVQVLNGRPQAALKRTNDGHKGQNNKDIKNGRKDTILSVLKEKGPSDIKDISGTIRGVSEKTIQRELQSLIDVGKVKKTGERRWTTYQIKETA